jgi:L-threonylcarbamoyladenylate synthase
MLGRRRSADSRDLRWRRSRLDISPADVAAFEACISSGGVAVFPTDTLYGLGCRAGDAAAAERVYALKRRPADKPSAVMYFSVEQLPRVGPRTRRALERLLPGPVLVVLPGGVGVRVPDAPELARMSIPVLQTSANLSGGRDPRRVEDVPESIRTGADLVLDGGELPGVPSTVVDLTRYESDGSWRVLRDGAVSVATLQEALR